MEILRIILHERKTVETIYFRQAHSAHSHTHTHILWIILFSGRKGKVVTSILLRNTIFNLWVFNYSRSSYVHIFIVSSKCHPVRQPIVASRFIFLYHTVSTSQSMHISGLWSVDKKVNCAEWREIVSAIEMTSHQLEESLTCMNYAVIGMCCLGTYYVLCVYYYHYY